MIHCSRAWLQLDAPLAPLKQQPGIHRHQLRSAPFAAAPAAAHQQQRPDYQFQPPLQRKRLAVFVSGGGSNLKAIQAAFQAGAIRGELAAVVSDKPGCGGWQFAESLQIPTIAYSGGDPANLPRTLDEVHGVDCVALAGFLKLIPVELVQHFRRAIINIHPGLLPAFGGKGLYGQRVHKAVVASGARYTGATVHFCDENYDTGPILSQSIVPVHPDDTPAQVAAKVLQTEHVLLPAAISALMDGRIAWRADGIPVLLEAR